MRNTNIEVLRCFLMFMIVLNHAYYHGIYGVDDAAPFSHSWWHFCFNTLVVWHVDGFVCISGWFGIRFSWRKFLSLYGQIVFYSLVGFCVTYLFSNHAENILHSFCISGGWFGGSYLLLMFFAPMLNAAVESLYEKSPRILISTWAIMAIGYFLASPPFINRFTAVRTNGFGPYTVLTLILVYLTARVARKCFTQPIPLKKLLLACLIFPIGLLCSRLNSLVAFIVVGDSTRSAPSLGYNDPAVYMFAVAIFCIFYWHVNTPAWLGKVCKFLGPSMFGIYLLHDATQIGPSIYRIPETWLASYTGLHPAMTIIICAITTFAFCLVIDLFRRLLTKMIFAKVYAILARIDDVWRQRIGALG